MPAKRPRTTPDRLLPTLKDIERAFGEAAWTWDGRCYTVASAVIDKGLCKGRAVYGHWLGPISPKSSFSAKMGVGFCQHGWVQLPDGRILDPTRWAFEAVKPYVYIGPNDHYDEGGNQWRMKHLGPPPDIYDDAYGHGAHVLDDLDPAAWACVVGLLQLEPDQPPSTITTTQAAWLAHLAPDCFGDHARAVFTSLKKHRLGFFIPLDNQRAVLGGP